MLLPELLPVEPLVLGAELGEAGEAPVELPVEEPLEPDEPLELPLMPDDEPLVPPLELVPDLKWASHSWRETWPSPFLSTEVKLGCELLPELDELGEADEPPAALDELPLFELSLEAAGEDDELLPCLAASAATARDDRAKSAAAVVMEMVLII